MTYAVHFFLLSTVNQLLNFVLFNLKKQRSFGSISEPVGISPEPLDDPASETITITSDRQQPLRQLSACDANTRSSTGSPPPTSPLYHRALTVVTALLHGSIYFHKDLNLE